jgi:hypothetical protein
MEFSRLEQIALDIRRQAVERSGLTGVEAILAIVAPSPELYALSIKAAEKKAGDRAKQSENSRPPTLVGWL